MTIQEIVARQREQFADDEFKSFFKRPGGGEGERCHYPVRLDLYGKGRQNDCSYCYAKSLLNFRKLWNPAHPAVANVAKVERVIRTKLHAGDTVRLGGMTDCFQGLEATRRATYETIKMLNAARVHYLIVTKCPLVARDDYLAIYDRDLCHVQVSITSTDDAVAATYEHAPKPSERIAAIEKLQAAGVDVALRLSPLIPPYVDFDIINAVRCDKIQVEFLRVNGWIEKWFPIDYREYTLHEGGYRHLPLFRKLDYLRKITGFPQVSVCEDVTAHYWYFQEHTNYNPDDCCNLRGSTARAFPRPQEDGPTIFP